MIGATEDGLRIEKWGDRSDGDPRVASATDSEIRGLLAKLLILHKIDLRRIPNILACKRAQLFVDLKRPTEGLALAMAGSRAPDPSRAECLDLDDLAA